MTLKESEAIVLRTYPLREADHLGDLPGDRRGGAGLRDRLLQGQVDLVAIDRPAVIKRFEGRGLLDLLGGAEEGKFAHGSGKVGPAGVTFNGINVNVDSATFDELTTPRMMYLWRGAHHFQPRARPRGRPPDAPARPE